MARCDVNCIESHFVLVRFYNLSFVSRVYVALSHRFCWEVGLADPGVVKDAA